MTDIFSGKTGDEVWRQAYRRLIIETSCTQASRLGATREILHANFHIDDPRQRWILSRQPALNPAFAIAEFFWILSGDNKSDLVNYWNPILPKFAGTGPTYHGAYGYRIRNHFGIDQLERAYYALKNKPSSRQVVIQIWDSKVDFPTQNGEEVDPDIPCNICAMPKVRHGKLEWLQIMRSNDLYLGTPHNFIQFTSMQEVLAGWLNINVGAYHQVCDSLHVYEHDILNCTCIDEALPQNLDNLSVSKNEFDEQMARIIPSLYELISPSLTTQNFKEIISPSSLITSYYNMLLICAADSARRRGWLEEMNEALKLCKNALLLFAFSRWLERRPIEDTCS